MSLGDLHASAIATARGVRADECGSVTWKVGFSLTVLRRPLLAAGVDVFRDARRQQKWQEES
jgi:hypothetical protein